MDEQIFDSRKDVEAPSDALKDASFISQSVASIRHPLGNLFSKRGFSGHFPDNFTYPLKPPQNRRNFEIFNLISPFHSNILSISGKDQPQKQSDYPLCSSIFKVLFRFLYGFQVIIGDQEVSIQNLILDKIRILPLKVWYPECRRS
jgi:hypothetical protein